MGDKKNEMELERKEKDEGRERWEKVRRKRREKNLVGLGRGNEDIRHEGRGGREGEDEKR